MQFVLCGSIIGLAVLSYHFAGKDFFTPATLLNCAFSISSVLCVYMLFRVPYELHGMTVWILLSNLAIGTALGIIVYRWANKWKIEPKVEAISAVPDWFCVLTIILIVISSFLILKEVSEIAGISNSYSEMMRVFRTKNLFTADEEAQLSVVVRELMNLLYIISIICAFSLIRCYKDSNIKTTVLALVVVGGCLAVSLLAAARATILTYAIAVAFIAHMIRIQTLGEYKPYGYQTILGILAIILVIGVAFYLLKGVVGRVDDSNIIDYMANYFGTGIINFDIFLQNPTHAEIFGEETFYSLIKNLRTLHILDIDNYVIYNDFQTVGDVDLGNLFTGFKSYYHDFGLWGVYIFHSSFVFGFSAVYEWIKRSRYNLAILIYSIYCYTIVNYISSQDFFSTALSAGFIIRCVMMVILYYFLLRKNITINGSTIDLDIRKFILKKLSREKGLGDSSGIDACRSLVLEGLVFRMRDTGSCGDVLMTPQQLRTNSCEPPSMLCARNGKFV